MQLIKIKNTLYNYRWKVLEESGEKLAPITFKIPVAMLEIINEMVAKGMYKNKAEVIREAIDELITWGPEARFFDKIE